MKTFNKFDTFSLTSDKMFPYWTLNRAEREKMNKYQNLKQDLKDNFDLEEIEIIPVILRATGLVKKNIVDLLRNIPREP